MILRVLRRLAVQSTCLRRRTYSEPLRFILLGAQSNAHFTLPMEDEILGQARLSIRQSCQS